MTPLQIITFIKYISIAIFIGIIGYGVWDIQHTYAKNKEYVKQIQTQTESINTLNGELTTQKDLNAKLLARKAEVEIVEKERIVYVDRIKKGDTVYVQTSKKEAEIIKQERPKELDKYYLDRYNTILICIEDTTKNKDNKCDTP